MDETLRHRHAKFHYQSLAELRADIAEMALEIPLSAGRSLFAAPLTVAGRTIPNRLVIHPMEGFDATPDGAPGPLASRRYQRYAAGGAGLVWAEATAILPEARSNPGQFWLHAGNVDAYARLVRDLRETAAKEHGHRPLLLLQLTHSGRYSKPAGKPTPLLAHHSPVLDPAMNLAPGVEPVSDDYLAALPAHFAESAKLAAQAGFDGVDLKCCHRYLLSELLASHTRPGRYGGSFENRTRLLREALAAVRAAAPGLLLTVRMNAYDAIPHPYGFGMATDGSLAGDLSEPLELIRQLRQLGVELVNISIGNPYFQAHYGRPYDLPLRGLTSPAEHPLAGIERFVKITRAIQLEFPDLPIVGTGYSWLRQFLPDVAAGMLERGWASLIGIGRQAFAYPDLPRDLLAHGAIRPEKCCVACSGCTQLMRDGVATGCVIRDSAHYSLRKR
ncbi:MAG: flavin oxidoreductase/NADH oxidase [Lentisphaeria bacterium]|jgi:2,4-dienoyl-CoA reductase-like NADH-dependent reductase (Old Yellow Enzyme family)